MKERKSLTVAAKDSNQFVKEDVAPLTHSVPILTEKVKPFVNVELSTFSQLSLEALQLALRPEQYAVFLSFAHIVEGKHWRFMTLHFNLY